MASVVFSELLSHLSPPPFVGNCIFLCVTTLWWGALVWVRVQL